MRLQYFVTQLYCLFVCLFAQLTKQKDESVREKDGMVMKFAQAEQKNIELVDKLQKAEAAMKEFTTEKENLTTYLHALRADKQKLKELLEKRVCLLLISLLYCVSIKNKSMRCFVITLPKLV